MSLPIFVTFVSNTVHWLIFIRHNVFVLFSKSIILFFLSLNFSFFLSLNFSLCLSLNLIFLDTFICCRLIQSIYITLHGMTIAVYLMYFCCVFISLCVCLSVRACVCAGSGRPCVPAPPPACQPASLPCVRVYVRVLKSEYASTYV